MQTEIEAKFMNVAHDKTRDALKSLGADLQKPSRLMRRTVFEAPDEPFEKNEKHLRVRDEGDKITMTVKKIDDRDSVTGVKEIETTVGDYETTVELLKEIGLPFTASQESKRESWLLDGCQIELDEWPWLSPFIEIEGPTEAAVRAVAAKLGFNWQDAKFGSVTMIYRTEYDIPEDVSIGIIPRISFDGPMPEYLANRKRNKEQ